MYIFGNLDVKEDALALTLIDRFKKEFPSLSFIEQDSNQDFLPEEREVIIIDPAAGIDYVTVIKDVNQLERTPTVSLHDFDLSFTLKLLKKLGRIDSVTIIALPQFGDINEVFTQTTHILHRLVQQTHD